MKIGLYTAQENIEQESRASTIQRYGNELAEKIQNEEHSSTHYGASLLKRAIEPMADIIDAEREATKAGKAGNATVAWRKIGDLKSDTAAYLASREVINVVMSNFCVSEAAMKVGQVYEDEHRYMAFSR